MSRIIIISNRLPITVDKKDSGLHYYPSAGGLATGLNSLKDDSERIWIGWPGDIIEDESQQQLVTAQLEEEGMVPVFISQEEKELYYEGFSNKTIWPHFHYFPQYTEYSKATWNSYKEVNQKFADVVESIVQADDLIWVHDYQLMLLPALIRKNHPENLIGFFLHIPFPSYELFRVLPWRKELLRGVLGSDLVGFHIFGYMRHFLSSAYRLLGYEHNLSRIQLPDRDVQVDIFPMGIDFDKFSNQSINEDNFKALWKISDTTKKILSIDRLDYSKGIKRRLEAFEYFLKDHTQYREKTSLILIVVPSRSGVSQYQELKEEIDTMVGRINGEYGKFDWAPIYYFYRSFEFEELCALYRMADIALVTPLRDGMNLIAKEYIACNKERAVLILSEMAGAAKELGESIIINPNDLDAMVNAIIQALEMPEAEQIERLSVMRNRLARFTVNVWANSFIDELKKCRKTDPIHTTLSLNPKLFNKEVVSKYNAANKRLIVLDYDGTLMPFHKDPQAVAPDDEVCHLIESFIKDKKNKVVLSSGRDRATLERWLPIENLDISAEHGVWTKRDNVWRRSEGVSNKWKEDIRALLDHLVRRTPGSFIEEKEFALVWHYRAIDQDLGAKRVREFKDVLAYIILNNNLQILEGNKVVEIKNAGINKGKALYKWMGEEDYDFKLVIGDDSTDEDMFEVLSPDDCSIKVGLPPSHANYYLNDVQEVRYILKALLQEN